MVCCCLRLSIHIPIFSQEPFHAAQRQDQEEQPAFVNDRFVPGLRMDDWFYLRIVAYAVFELSEIVLGKKAAACFVGELVHELEISICS